MNKVKARQQHMRIKRNAIFMRATALPALLHLSSTALAGNPMLNHLVVDPTAQAAQAAQSQAARTAAATTTTQRSFESVARAVAAVRAQEAAQKTARDAAVIAQSSIPNGLKPGGLQVDKRALDANGNSINPDLWIGAKAPVEFAGGNGTTNVTIEQTQPKAVLTWETFNVGKDTDVYFNQKAGDVNSSDGLGSDGWVALNRVIDPNSNPSQILGKMHADGQVWVINRNGIMFGGSSQIDTHALVASSLDIYSGLTSVLSIGDTDEELRARNQKYLDGFLLNGTQALDIPLGFNYSRTTPLPRLGELFDGSQKSDSNEVFAAHDGVTVEAGAEISTESLGHVYLFGHNVTNKGSIETSDGQVLMAAGRSMYLESAGANLLVAADRGGTASNTGMISSRRGDITLTGKRVENGGVLEASSSSLISGSVHLIAGDYANRGEIFDPYDFTAMVYSGLYGYGYDASKYLSEPLRALHYGELELLSGAVVAITPDVESTAKVQANAPLSRSTVDLRGYNVTLGMDSLIYAPSGTVNLLAIPGGYKDMIDPQPFKDPVVGIVYPKFIRKPINTRLYIDKDAMVSVAGLRDVQLPIDSNTLLAPNGLTPDWRLNELRDVPVQRDSFLRGDRVPVDVRFGTQLADLTGYYSLSQQNVLQRMTTGGTIALDSSQIITRVGSILDVSGGSVQYSDGYVPDTRILGADGKVYRLDKANPNFFYVDYAGTAKSVHQRWNVEQTYLSPFIASGTRYESAYTVGYDAGTIKIGPDSVSTAIYAGGTTSCEDYLDFFCNVPSIPKLAQLDGDIRGDVVVGQYQTDRIATKDATAENAWRRLPQAASFVMGALDAGKDTFDGLVANSVNVVNGYLYANPIRVAPTTQLPDDFTATTALPPTSEIVVGSHWFENGAFTNVSFGTGTGDLLVDDGSIVNLGAYGTFNFSGRSIELDGQISSPGGSVSLDATATTNVFKTNEALNLISPAIGGDLTSVVADLWNSLPAEEKNHIRLGDHASIDVSGLWGNEIAGPSRVGSAINGGTVTLRSAGDLEMAPSALIDVGGGGKLLATGKLQTGAAGSINLTYGAPLTLWSIAGEYYGADDTVDVNLRYNDLVDYNFSLGELHAYGLNGGGTLSLTLQTAVSIEDQPTSNAIFGDDLSTLDPAFFSAGGFANYTINSRNFQIVDNTVLAPHVDTYLWDSMAAPVDGARMQDSFAVGKPNDIAPPPMSLNFSLAGLAPSRSEREFVEGQKAVVGTGVNILLDPLSTFSIVSSHSTALDGAITAPGGKILIEGSKLAYYEFISARPGTDAEERGSVVLGPNARLSVPGYVSQVSRDGSAVRAVGSAGSIELKGGLVLTDQQAVLDISGVSGIVDAKRVSESTSDLVRTTSTGRESVMIGGDAGSLLISGMASSRLGAEILAKGGSDLARNGSIRYVSADAQHGGEMANSTKIYYDVPVDLLDGDTTELAGYFPAVTFFPTVPKALSTPGYVDFGRWRDSGADYITLDIAETRLIGAVDLTAGKNLNLITGRFAVIDDGNASQSVLLHAPTAQLGGRLNIYASDPQYTLAQDINFEMKGSQLVLAPSQFVGFDSASLEAQGDIALNGVNWTFTGPVTLESAQIHPGVGMTSVFGNPNPNGFNLTGSISSASSISIIGNGEPAPVAVDSIPGGAINFAAPLITQGGVLRAPLGTINLNASEALELAPGSVTSVSLDNNVLPDQIAFSANVVHTSASTPGLINLAAPSITVSGAGNFNGESRQAAVVDASGSGDLVRGTFVTGNGGSSDILTSPGMFAIRPAANQEGSYFSNYASPAKGVGLNIGDHIYLDDAPGIPAGEYVVMPPAYALADDAYAIQFVETGYAQLPVGSNGALADGSSVVGGRRIAKDGRPGDQLYSTYKLIPSTTVRAYSHYEGGLVADSARSKAIADETPVPKSVDSAGTIKLSVQTASTSPASAATLLLNGDLRLGAPELAYTGQLDINSSNIVVTDSVSTLPGTEGYFSLSTSLLKRLEVPSIGLTAAQNLVIGTTSAEPLRAPNATLKANGGVLDIKAGSVIDIGDSAGISAGILTLQASSDILIGDSASLSATGDLNVGNARDVTVGNGAQLTAGDNLTVSAVRDTLLGSATKLTADNAMTLGGTNSVRTSSDTVLNAAALSLSSSRISLGDAPDGTTGIVLSNGAVSSLTGLGDLSLKSTGSIDFYGTVDLGDLTLKHLALDAVSFTGIDASVSISADTLDLIARSGVAGINANATGELLFTANTLYLSSNGVVNMPGFTGVITDVGQLLLDGSGTLSTSAPLVIQADKINATSKSNFTLMSSDQLLLKSSTGNKTITPADVQTNINAATQVSRPVSGGGAQLNLSGKTVHIDTLIEAPGGIINVLSNGEQISLGSNARLNAPGIEQKFYEIDRFANGGQVNLNTSGFLIADSGSELNVSGATGGGDAGSIVINAAGMADIHSSIHLGAADGYEGGDFELRAGDIPSLDVISDAFDANGVSGHQIIETSNGDLVLSVSKVIRTHNLLLRAQNGNISIEGNIDASGYAADPSGGDIRIEANGDVVIAGTSVLSADAVSNSVDSFPVHSGQIELNAVNGAMTIDPAATFSALGGIDKQGTVAFNVARVGSDVSLNGIGNIAADKVIVRGMGNYVVDDGVLDTEAAAIQSESVQWRSANAAAVSTRLGGDLEVATGARINSGDVDLLIATDLNFAGRSGSGLYEFKALNDLLVNNSVSDGFATVSSFAAQLTGNSASLRFTAGRDVVVGTAQPLIRTGTGDIDFTAGRNIVLGGASATAKGWAIYTAGHSVANAIGYAPPATENRVGSFPVDGGNIHLYAGDSIRSVWAGDWAPTNWQFRYGYADIPNSVKDATVASQQSWSIVYFGAQTLVGTLGGGNIDVRAHGDITNLSVVAPTTGQQTTPVGGAATRDEVNIRGGGDINIKADKNFNAGFILASLGRVDISAGGILGGANGSVSSITNLAIGDARFDLTARNGIGLVSAFDPMMIRQTESNAPNWKGTSFFTSYTERSELNLLTLLGDITCCGSGIDYPGLPDQGITPRGAKEPNNPTVGKLPGSSQPSTVRLTALGGNVVGGLVVAPSAYATFEVVAKGEVKGGLSMLDRSPDYIWGVGTPFTTNSYDNLVAPANNQFYNYYAMTPIGTAENNFLRGTELLHANDRVPVRIYTGTGDITNLALAISKSVDIHAGGDLINLNLNSFNTDMTDQSLVSAERDIKASIVSVGGPGRVDISAGRDIKGLDVYTRGQIDGPIFDGNPTLNEALPLTGASVSIMAGAAGGAHYAEFAALYLDPTNGGNVVKTYVSELRDYIKGLGVDDAALTDQEVVTAFNNLSMSRQKVFLHEVLMSEIKLTSQEYVDPTSPRHLQSARAKKAYETLFPYDPDNLSQTGDIQFHNGVKTVGTKPTYIPNSGYVETQSGGDISLLAPYGGILFSYPDTPPIDATKKQLPPGVVTRRGGNINALAGGLTKDDPASTAGNIELVLSRLFTLQGGDIVGASMHGDILAGNGAKTVAIVAPSIPTINPDGARFINVFGLATGSGIGTLDSLSTKKNASSVYLFAPEGSVDAGDAGLRSTKNLFVAALKVLNADNVDVQGQSFGLPPPRAVDTGALVSASDAVRNALADVVKQVQPQGPRQIPSVFDGQFLGFGEEPGCASTTQANGQCNRQP